MAGKALITGITGQDGSYLAEFLLGKGYEVHGLIRRSSTFNTERIDHIYVDPHEQGARLLLHYGDLTDGMGLRHVLTTCQPDEIYNLGAQSHVRVSFDQPVYTCQADAIGTLRLLEAIRDSGLQTRFYQASSSEMFGKVAETPQTEKTPLHPRSPYACAKVFSHYQTINYREAYGLFACSGILFNHESPRRGETFVTRKITQGAVRIKLGKQKELLLGNLDSERDWGFAGDYTRAMHMMLQHPEADDYVIGSGECHKISEFAELAFRHLGLDWRDYVRSDPKFIRPAEVEHLCADATKAHQKLGWQPTVDFKGLVEMMVESDLKLESGS